MKRKLISLFGGLAILICLIFACSKNETNLDELFDKKIIQKSGTIEDAENAGVLHNQILDYLLHTKNFYKFSNKDTYETICRFYRENGILNNMSFEEFVETNDLIRNYANASMTDISQKLADQNIISTKAIDYIRTIEEIIQTITNDDIYYGKLENIQNQIFNDESLSKDDQYFLIGTISIAKHSNEYWSCEKAIEWTYLLLPDLGKQKAKQPACPDYFTFGDKLAVRWADVCGWVKGCFSGNSPSTASSNASGMKMMDIIIEKYPEHVIPDPFTNPAL